jgi:hypothetical protein
MLHCRDSGLLRYNAPRIPAVQCPDFRRFKGTMLLFDNPLLRYGLLLVGAVFLLALLYFVYAGVRALFREARDIARHAGHRDASATLRAMARMTVWALFFLAFYLAAFFLGRRLGWWGVPAGMGAFVVMVAGLLLAEKLLTVRPGDARADVGIGAAVTGILGLFAVVIWVAA